MASKDKRSVEKWKVYGKQFASMNVLAGVLYGLSSRDMAKAKEN